MHLPISGMICQFVRKIILTFKLTFPNWFDVAGTRIDIYIHRIESNGIEHRDTVIYSYSFCVKIGFKYIYLPFKMLICIYFLFNRFKFISTLRRSINILNLVDFGWNICWHFAYIWVKMGSLNWWFYGYARYWIETIVNVQWSMCNHLYNSFTKQFLFFFFFQFRNR